MQVFSLHFQINLVLVHPVVYIPYQVLVVFLQVLLDPLAYADLLLQLLPQSALQFCPLLLSVGLMALTDLNINLHHQSSLPYLVKYASSYLDGGNICYWRTF